ncbi:hypothetical protein IM774_11920 [Erysipelotrichaceae bacterium RD49]|nr:hypothetical protein [Erysipelotrichaceae bacterium RD49]
MEKLTRNFFLSVRLSLTDSQPLDLSLSSESQGLFLWAVWTNENKLWPSPPAKKSGDGSTKKTPALQKQKAGEK